LVLRGGKSSKNDMTSCKLMADVRSESVLAVARSEKYGMDTPGAACESTTKNLTSWRLSSLLWLHRYAWHSHKLGMSAFSREPSRHANTSSRAVHTIGPCLDGNHWHGFCIRLHAAVHHHHFLAGRAQAHLAGIDGGL
jgi:hypothetical protein